MKRRAVAALLCTAGLGACAVLPTGTDGMSFDRRRQTLESIDSWEMRGRLTVDTGDRGVQGRFTWKQDSEALELTVRNPLGAGVLRVAGPPGALTVTARGETRTLTDPEVELSELVGWWLPVASLSRTTGSTSRAASGPGVQGWEGPVRRTARLAGGARQ